MVEISRMKKFKKYAIFEARKLVEDSKIIKFWRIQDGLDLLGAGHGQVALSSNEGAGRWKYWKREKENNYSSSLHDDLSFEVWREASPVGHNRCQWQWIRLLLRSLHCENFILKILIGYFHKRHPIDFFHEKENNCLISGDRWNHGSGGFWLQASSHQSFPEVQISFKGDQEQRQMSNLRFIRLSEWWTTWWRLSRVQRVPYFLGNPPTVLRVLRGF